MKILLMALPLFFMCSAISAAASSEIPPCNIRLAGDSTMQTVDPEKSPDFGWGQVLPELSPTSTHIVNYAKGGRSTKTFITENRWQQLISDTQPGDWVLIQFGHNDAAYEKPERYTAPVDFENNLRRFVRDTKAKNATPVLVSPVVRRHFDDEGKLRDVHGIYPSLVKKVSEEMDVPLIDLFKRSRDKVLELGVIDSIDLFVHIGPSVHSCCPEGRIDNTHFTKKGALEIAALVVDEIQTTGLQGLYQCFSKTLK